MPQKNRSLLDKTTASQTMVDGLLGLMPVGCRNATYISSDAMEKIGKEGLADRDIFGVAGVTTWSHGPYLDDWSKVTRSA